MATLDEDTRSKMLASVTCSELCAPRSGYWKLERGPELEMPGLSALLHAWLYMSIANLQLRALLFFGDTGQAASPFPTMSMTCVLIIQLQRRSQHHATQICCA